MKKIILIFLLIVAALSFIASLGSAVEDKNNIIIFTLDWIAAVILWLVVYINF